MNERVDEGLDGIGYRDHSVTAEYRIIGPPGTGKTTNLTRQIGCAVDRFGDNGVLVTSFSRATAAELAGRDVPIDPDRIGTLHSHCFHALGKPAIAEAHVQEWNRANPRLKITPVSRQRMLDGEEWIEDDTEQMGDGDGLLQQLNRCRGMMLDRASWPADVREFDSEWSRYKAANRLLDFCDLIETSLRDVSTAPGNPAVVVVDEAQDLNRLQLTLTRAWGKRANYLVLAGDDDQTIYEWAGASPDAMLDPDIPEDHKVFLMQSARVPRTVHAVAERLIRQVSRRQEKTYVPRPADGEVHRLSQAGYRSPEYWILKTAERHIKQGKSIMFLAACSYMLRPIVAVLRKNGIPFHNPYRKSAGFWNPLRLSSRHSAANRILALLVDPQLLICETCLDTGTRISEAVGLQLKHFDPKKGTIRIEQRHCRGDVDEPKTKNSKRMLALGALVDRYQAWITAKGISKPTDWIFPQDDDRTKPMWDSGVRKELKKAARDTGCDFPGFGLHSFRRANITMRQEEGGSAIEASKIAGHATVSQTGDYTVVQLKRQEELTRAIQGRRAKASAENREKEKQKLATVEAA